MLHNKVILVTLDGGLLRCKIFCLFNVMPNKPTHQLAEARIQAVIADNSTALDLSGLDLATLPDALSELKWLTKLNLHSTQLTSIPDWLGNLSKLQYLNLGFNRLRVLPDSLGHLSRLEELYLFRNRLSTLPDSLSQLRNLKRLELGGN